ncbi:tRNA (adenosine(37)-N6)-dimethylallyltransferase MiaA [uncultured Eubacterium sp.]|uniref:tRNA (adenosine(37)-N6)-dimethylallyltransferase MiaA n=1 Tax=uncultured Eubacterium sp. TaxID=165185 RepID=UPI0015AB265E|nr:tRNA (adenosine(37)-N6)-dimethylallyltransferase MiaA [uncultured Eubacterium sp.]
MSKIKIICVVGPTASGKTALSVELAKAINGEIISADSMQVYKNMPIATAVATEEEKQGVPHHLTEFLDADKAYSVADFVKDAAEKIKDISDRGKVPVIAGGTGLFVDSLANGVTFGEVGVIQEIRDRLQALDNEMLYNRLKMLDPQAAEDIHPNNRKRVIRALELCLAGTTKTEQNEKSLLAGSPYDALYIGISYSNRQVLYDRINRRVDIMLENGLEAEARNMLNQTGKTACQAIGHKELTPYINGEISYDTAVENLKRATRRYAKRQLTWFRRNENINWLIADKMTGDELVGEAVNLAKDFIRE